MTRQNVQIATIDLAWTPRRTSTCRSSTRCFTVGDVPPVRRRRADGGRTAAGTFTVE